MPYAEGRKLLTIEHREGPVLISTDLHGNLDDFHRLREVFEREPRCLWVSVGDWVHGPADGERRDVTSDDGEILYDYDDRTPRLLEELFPAVARRGKRRQADAAGAFHRQRPLRRRRSSRRSSTRPGQTSMRRESRRPRRRRSS